MGSGGETIMKSQVLWAQIIRPTYCWRQWNLLWVSGLGPINTALCAAGAREIFYAAARSPLHLLMGFYHGPCYRYVFPHFPLYNLNSKFTKDRKYLCRQQCHLHKTELTFRIKNEHWWIKSEKESERIRGSESKRWGLCMHTGICSSLHYALALWS